jgi:hypothetical protein
LSGRGLVLLAAVAFGVGSGAGCCPAPASVATASPAAGHDPAAPAGAGTGAPANDFAFNCAPEDLGSLCAAFTLRGEFATVARRHASDCHALGRALNAYLDANDATMAAANAAWKDEMTTATHDAFFARHRSEVDGIKAAIKQAAQPCRGVPAVLLATQRFQKW